MSFIFFCFFQQIIQYDEVLKGEINKPLIKLIFIWN